MTLQLTLPDETIPIKYSIKSRGQQGTCCLSHGNTDCVVCFLFFISLKYYEINPYLILYNSLCTENVFFDDTVSICIMKLGFF